MLYECIFYRQYDQKNSVMSVYDAIPALHAVLGFDVLINVANPIKAPPKIPLMKDSRKHGILPTSLPKITND